jgi:hypothetical protein
MEFMTETVRNTKAVNEWLNAHKKSIENKHIEVMSIISNPEYGISTTARFTISYVKRDKVVAVAR